MFVTNTTVRKIRSTLRKCTEEQSIISYWVKSTQLADVRLRNTAIGTYLLTPWRRDLLETVIGSQSVKNFPEFYGTRRFINAFTSAHHQFLPWARSIPSMTPTRFLKIHLNIILPSTSRSSKRSISLSCTHQNPVHISSLSHTCYMPRPPHSSRFYHPNNIWWEV